MLLAFVVVAVLAICWLVSWIRRGWGMTTVAVSERRYRVRDREGKEEVARMLYSLQNKMEGFRSYLRAGPYADRPQIRNVLSRWDGSLSETSQGFGGEAAYTTDKRDISVCVRDARGDMEDANTAVYIVLHEVGHIANDGHGHDAAFWKTFRFLLRLAVEHGVYVYQPFERQHKTYCGVPIKSSEYSCVLAGTCAAEL